MNIWLKGLEKNRWDVTDSIELKKIWKILSRKEIYDIVCEILDK